MAVNEHRMIREHAQNYGQGEIVVMQGAFARCQSRPGIELPAGLNRPDQSLLSRYNS